MRGVLVERRNSSQKTLSRFSSGWGGCQSIHGMSLVQIAFLSFRLAGYFTANAGGGGIPAKLHTLLRGVGLRHPVIRRHVSFRAESIFPA